jgi:adenylate cyclase
VSVQPVERKLAAIFAADIAGYSRLMARDEVGTLARLKACRAIVDKLIASHQGCIFNTAGDSVVADFASAVNAVQCAVAVQEAIEKTVGTASEPMRFRIGVHVGDVMVDGENLLGDGVNIAARLEALAEPGAICVSATARDHIGNKLPHAFDYLGEQEVKNIAQPVRVYRVQAETSAPPAAAALALPDKPSIAVLPFANMSGDPEQEYFADGIAEDIITLLSKSRGLFVIARNSTFTYKGHAVDVKTIGRELGVRYVLEGSVRKAGNRVRVTGQLIEAATGGHLWAERYDRDLNDIFAVQDEITGSVSAAILPTMERSERERAARKPPDSLDAWESYQRGMWHFFKFNPTDNQLARPLFERSLQLDANSALALAGMALTYLWEAWLFRPMDNRSATVSIAANYARKCLAIDPTDAMGHLALASSLLMLGLHRQSIAEAELAISCDANHAWSHGAVGATRAFGGRPSEAVEPLLTALRLSPFDPLDYAWHHWMSRAYYWSGDYESAILAAQRVWRSHPQVGMAGSTLIAALGQMGRVEEAKQVMAEAMLRYDTFAMPPIQQPEQRVEDYEHLVEGCRKAGVLNE